MEKINQDCPDTSVSVVLAYQVDSGKKKTVRHLLLHRGHDGHSVTVENIPPFLTGTGLCQLVNEALERIFKGKVKLATTIVDDAKEGESPKGYRCCEIRLRTNKQARLLLDRCSSLARPICLSELADFHLPTTGIEKYASAYNSQFTAMHRRAANKSVAEIIASYEAGKAQGEQLATQQSFHKPTGADEDGWTVVTKEHRLAFKAPVNRAGSTEHGGKRITSATAKRVRPPGRSNQPDEKRKKRK